MGDRRRLSPANPPATHSHRIHGRPHPPDLYASSRWTSTDSTHDLRSPQRAAPLMIRHRQQQQAAPPPPLPPPTCVPDIEQGNDLGWQYGNRSHPYVGPQESRYGFHSGDFGVGNHDPLNRERNVAARLDDTHEPARSPSSPWHRELSQERPNEMSYRNLVNSTTSSHLQGENNLQRQNRKHSSHAYDQQLLSSLNGPRTPIKSPVAESLDTSPASRRLSMQSPKVPPLKNLSISERSTSISSEAAFRLNSPLTSSKWATSPQSQTGLISPGQASASASARSFAGRSTVSEECGSISSSMSSMPTREEIDRIGLRVPVPGPRSKGSDSSLSLAMKNMMATNTNSSNNGGGNSNSNSSITSHDVAKEGPPIFSRDHFGISALVTGTPHGPHLGGTPTSIMTSDTTSSTTTATASYSHFSPATSPYSPPYATPSSTNNADPNPPHLYSRPLQHHPSSSNQFLPLNSPSAHHHATAPPGGGARVGGEFTHQEAATAHPASFGGLRPFAFHDRSGGPFPPHSQHQPGSLYLSTSPQPRVFLDEPSSPLAGSYRAQLPVHHRHTSQSRQIMSARKRSAAEISGAPSSDAEAIKSEDGDRLTSRKPNRQASPSSPNAAAQHAFSNSTPVTNGSYPQPSGMSLESGAMLSSGNMSKQMELPEERALIASLDPSLHQTHSAPAPPNLADMARQASAAVTSEVEAIKQLQNANLTSGGNGAHVCDCCPKKPRKFATAQELQQHQNEKQYTCQWCHNRFKNKNEAERHQNSLHLRRHSWSCAALDRNQPAAFHPANAVPPNTSGNQTQQQQQQPPGYDSFDLCGYCGMPFPNEPSPDWVQRTNHLTTVHKFGECNQSKKFFRADHFRQHLKHSHNGKAGKWTNMLETACMREEPPMTPEAQSQEQLRLQQQQHQQQPSNQTPGPQQAHQPLPPPASQIGHGVGNPGPAQAQSQSQSQQSAHAQMRAQAQLAAARVISENKLQLTGDSGAPVMSLEDQAALANANASAPIAMMGSQHGYANMQQQHDPHMHFRGSEGQNLKSE